MSDLLQGGAFGKVGHMLMMLERVCQSIRLALPPFSCQGTHSQLMREQTTLKQSLTNAGGGGTFCCYMRFCLIWVVSGLSAMPSLLYANTVVKRRLLEYHCHDTYYTQEECDPIKSDFGTTKSSNSPSCSHRVYPPTTTDCHSPTDLHSAKTTGIRMSTRHHTTARARAMTRPAIGGARQQDRFVGRDYWPNGDNGSEAGDRVLEIPSKL